MNKGIIIGLLLLVLAQLSFAGNTYDFQFTNSAGSPVTDVDLEAFQCSVRDGSCATVRSDYSVNLNSGTEDAITYEARGLSQPTDYAVYFYKEGFLPKKGLVKADFGTGINTDVPLTFEKKDMCVAPIVGYNLVNTVYANEPLQVDVSARLDTETASAFKYATFAPHYQPDSWRNEYASLFSATTRMRLDVLDANGTIVHSERQVRDIMAEETAHFVFTFTPTVAGVYTVKVSSRVPDDQCAASTPMSDAKVTTVLPDRPNNIHYTLLQNFHYDPAHPIVGENIDASVNYISIYADVMSQLFPTATKLTYTLKEGKSNPAGAVVWKKVVTAPKASSPTDYSSNTINFSVANVGWYTLYVRGEATDMTVAAPNNYEKLSAEIYINPRPANTFDYTITVKDAANGQFLRDAVGQISSGAVVYSTSQGQITFTQLSPSGYNYAVSKSGYRTKTGLFTIVNSNGGEIIDLARTQCNDGADNDNDGRTDLADGDCSSISDDNESPSGLTPQCSDGLDNDNDRFVDMQDPDCTSPSDDSEDQFTPGLYQCSDRLDNDNDGYVDLSDPDCTGPRDDTEDSFTPGNTQCSDNIDNDNDGFVDLRDTDCTDATDDTEDGSVIPPTPQCRDGVDNDQDMLVDMDDPNCSDPNDDSEGPFTPGRTQCSDGVDNDNDLFIDLQDPGCSNPADNSELPFNPGRTQCSDGLDNDADGMIDLNDSDCTGPEDNLENGLSPVTQCSDGIDNDGDLFIDLDDPGCTNAQDDSEAPFNLGRTQCSDTIDNDGDSLVDMADPGCSSQQDNNELNLPPGFTGLPEKRYPGIQVVAFDFYALEEYPSNGRESFQTIYTSIDNFGEVDVDNVVVTLSIPELAIWDRKGPFDLEQGEDERLAFMLDVPAHEEGWYYARLDISGDNFNKAKWYEVYMR